MFRLVDVVTYHATIPLAVLASKELISSQSINVSSAASENGGLVVLIRMCATRWAKRCDRLNNAKR